MALGCSSGDEWDEVGVESALLAKPAYGPMATDSRELEGGRVVEVEAGLEFTILWKIH